jgi:flagellar L-ring protein precursor FlgH
MNTTHSRRRLNRVITFFAIIWAAWMATHAQAQTPPQTPEATKPATTQAETPRPSGSLWQDSGTGSLYQDFRARKVGDTITILVQESATANSQAATKASKAESGSFSGLSSSFGPLNRLLKPLSMSNTESQDGQGSTNRTGSLTTRLSAIVKEVMPNGNLVIEATRDVTINAEKQKVTVRGIIRPVDVSAANTVSSISIADASIKMDGKGPVGDRQKKGILSRIFGWLF